MYLGNASTVLNIIPLKDNGTSFKINGSDDIVAQLFENALTSVSTDMLSLSKNSSAEDGDAVAKLLTSIATDVISDVAAESAAEAIIEGVEKAVENSTNSTAAPTTPPSTTTSSSNSDIDPLNDLVKVSN